MVELRLVNVQRGALHAMKRKSEFDEDLIRKYTSLLDLEEIKVRAHLHSKTKRVDQ